jgi:chromate transporter
VSTVVREWGRMGALSFGGPPAQVALLRDLTVERRRWLGAQEFEDANAATQLLPGPAGTQLAIFCAMRVGGIAGAILGGLAFILPGLLLVLAISAVALAESPPEWILGIGAGAAAAVVAVVVQAGILLVRSSLEARRGGPLARAIAYVAIGAAATVLAGAGLVLALLACGLVELAWRRRPGAAVHAWPVALVVAVTGAAALPAVAWTAFKVGALSYGGGFVIIPLMQHDAVDTYRWMTDGQFLNAVALGQVTPGPVVHTVAVVGYAAAGIGGGLLASFVAFAPSFSFILIGADRFDRLRANQRVRSFLDGAGPAAIGAIAGAAIPLALALSESWQFAILAAAVVALFVARRGVVLTLIAAGVAGVVAEALGAPLPG